MSNDTLRNADLTELAGTLQDISARSVDVVASASRLRSVDGQLHLEGCEPSFTEEGVTIVDGAYTPTRIGDEGIAKRLDIPLGYLQKMRSNNIKLYDQNVNAWLAYAPNERHLLRLLAETTTGDKPLLRAFLSPSYRTIDNFDVLMAVLVGMREGGLDANTQIASADLTDRRMVLRVTSTEVARLAPVLLERYRSPFGTLPGVSPQALARRNEELRRRGRDPLEPWVFAGLVVSNSETGDGAFNIFPRIEVLACTNGQVIRVDGLRKVHLGAKLDEGVVQSSTRTLRANLELIESQAADAVRTFLSEEYLSGAVERLEADAGVVLPDFTETITVVSKKLGFSKEYADNILDHFVRAGQPTAGGVMQAVTSFAQTLDADAAYELELAGVDAMREAAVFARARR